MHSHGLALVFVLWLPVTLVVAKRGLDACARRRVGPAERLLEGWLTTDRPTRWALYLMAVAAAAHLGLVIDHAGEPVISGLFMLDALALATLIVAALIRLPGWRPAAILLLEAAVAAYILYVASGREPLDVLGVGTKAVELAAIVLLWPSRVRTMPRRMSTQPELPNAQTGYRA